MHQIPLIRTETGHIVVPVQIGDHAPMNFLLDTGASMSVITRETSAQLGLDSDAKATAAGAGGAMQPVSLVTLDRVVVGDTEYRELSAAVIDLGHISTAMSTPVAGILGHNFLAEHDLAIDFPAGRLTLYRAGTAAADRATIAQFSKIPYRTFAVGLIRIDVAVAGKPPIPAVLDLGAQITIFNQPAADYAGLAPPPDADGATAGAATTAMGADNTALTCTPLAPADLTLGAATLSATPQVCDLPVFGLLGLATNPALILGFDALADRQLIIDFKNHTVYLSRASAQ